MARYNVEATWDDPYDQPVNRRSNDRFAIRIKMSITVEDPLIQRRLHGPGIVNDISVSGVKLRTKHRLNVGQRISLAIPTSMCPADLCLPEVFLGPAEVVRVEPHNHNGTITAALTFGAALTQNMEFVLFVESLQQHAAAQPA